MTKLLLCICAAAAVSCSSPVGIPDREPTVIGTIQQVRSGSVLIVPKTPPGACGFDFQVDGQTRILRQHSSGSPVAAGMSDLTVGAEAKAWADSVIMDSCPAVAHAGTIVLLQ